MSMHSLRFHGVVASLILSLFVVPFEFAHGGTSLVQVATNTAFAHAGNGGIGYPSCQYCPKPD